MDCLADTGLNPHTWLIVAFIAGATILAGIIMLRRQRRGGLAVVAVLALLLGGSLSLGPAQTATAAAAECAAQPAPAPTSSAPITSPAPTADPSATPSPSPTATPTAEPTPEPTATCVPGSPNAATHTTILATGALDSVQARAQVGPADASGSYPIAYQVQLRLVGQNAVDAAARMGLSVPAAGEPPTEFTEVPAATGVPVLAQIPADLTVTSTTVEFGAVETDAEAGAMLSLALTIFSSTTEPSRDLGIADARVVPITLTWPLAGTGTDCDGSPLADSLVITNVADCAAYDAQTFRYTTTAENSVGVPSLMVIPASVDLNYGVEFVYLFEGMTSAEVAERLGLPGAAADAPVLSYVDAEILGLVEFLDLSALPPRYAGMAPTAITVETQDYAGTAITRVSFGYGETAPDRATAEAAESELRTWVETQTGPITARMAIRATGTDCAEATDVLELTGTPRHL